MRESVGVDDIFMLGCIPGTLRRIGSIRLPQKRIQSGARHPVIKVDSTSSSDVTDIYQSGPGLVIASTALRYFLLLFRLFHRSPLFHRVITFLHIFEGAVEQKL